ncbi:MAG TPA: hypothetical protein VGG79_23770 [Roseiarcus sp.]|jgi:hypothetical protein
MKTNAVRFVAGLALVAFGAPFPAFGQYFPPPLIIVPPQAQEYARPRPRAEPPPPKPGPPGDAAPYVKPTGHYEGRTYVPD